MDSRCPTALGIAISEWLAAGCCSRRPIPKTSLELSGFQELTCSLIGFEEYRKRLFSGSQPGVTCQRLKKRNDTLVLTFAGEHVRKGVSSHHVIRCFSKGNLEVPNCLVGGLGVTRISKQHPPFTED